ncbi:electron transfer flavoprotein subunit beta/FixA family protein [Paradesulfitobacterium ferrireducens]|uniref:electron transfer flavoprotein subunit beta/FixA family protein n=1 Tax=Paradesulfitobacterium ferrireducens TaxID=2816476 RepID=UPI001A90C275|nr:hypothetical protein [Paradesulfitobacterium ferrireducens]
MPGRWEHDLEIAVPVGFWPHRAGPLTIENGCLSEKTEIVYDLGHLDHYALEEALKWKDRWGVKVTVVSVGPETHEEGMRQALSLGADEAVRLWDESLESFFPSAAAVKARMLAAWISERGCLLVLCGDKSSGSGSGMVGRYLAHFLARPNLVSVIQIDPLSESKLKVTCRGEKGSRLIYECPIPVVLSVGRGSETRYPTLPGRLAARQAEIPVFNLAQLQVEPAEIGVLASYARTARLAPARLKPKKILTPDSSMSASDRMKMILSGGVKKKKGNVAEGSQGGAAQIYDLLRQEGLV